MPTLHGDEVSPASVDGRVAPGVRAGTRGCGGGGGAPPSGATRRLSANAPPPAKRPARRPAPSGCGRSPRWRSWPPRSRAAPSPPARCCTTIRTSSRCPRSPASRSRPTRASRAPARSTPRPAQPWSRSAPTAARAPASSSIARARWSPTPTSSAAPTRVVVKFGTDGRSIDGEVKGADPSSDLAVVTIDPGSAPGNAKPLQFADSRQVRVGDTAIAIGNPFGLDRTATEGIVSGIGRSITAPNGFSIDEVIQTDAPINPGNSGGPLLDETGRVIGINSQIATAGGTSQGNVGIGFAVPSNTVREVVPRLEKGDRHRAPLPRRGDHRSAPTPTRRPAPRSPRSSPAAPPTARASTPATSSPSSTARPCKGSVGRLADRRGQAARRPRRHPRRPLRPGRRRSTRRCRTVPRIRRELRRPPRPDLPGGDPAS